MEPASKGKEQEDLADEQLVQNSATWFERRAGADAEPAALFLNLPASELNRLGMSYKGTSGELAAFCLRRRALRFGQQSFMVVAREALDEPTTLDAFTSDVSNLYMVWGSLLESTVASELQQYLGVGGLEEPGMTMHNEQGLLFSASMDRRYVSPQSLQDRTNPVEIKVISKPIAAVMREQAPGDTGRPRYKRLWSSQFGASDFMSLIKRAYDNVSPQGGYVHKQAGMYEVNWVDAAGAKDEFAFVWQDRVMRYYPQLQLQMYLEYPRSRRAQLTALWRRFSSTKMPLTGEQRQLVRRSMLEGGCYFVIMDTWPGQEGMLIVRVPYDDLFLEKFLFPRMRLLQGLIATDDYQRGGGVGPYARFATSQIDAELEQVLREDKREPKSPHKRASWGWQKGAAPTRVQQALRFLRIPKDHKNQIIDLCSGGIDAVSFAPGHFVDTGALPTLREMHALWSKQLVEVV